MDDLAALQARFDDSRFDGEAARAARSFIRYLLVERGMSQNTARAYALDLYGYFDWAARNETDPLHLSVRRFRRYLADLTRARYEKTTISRHLSSVRSFFSYLNQVDALELNPAAVAASPKLDHDLPRKTSDADIARLLSVCETDDPVGMRDQAFLELLYASGARISETAGLKAADVDFRRCEVRLFGKGGKERIVPLYPVCMAALQLYCEQGRPKLVRKPVDALFVSTRGNAMSADSLRKVFKRRAAQAGLDPSLHPHDMRHAFATDLVEGGADLRSVQEMLGHASLSTTQVYTHLSLRHMKDVYRQAHPRS